MQAVAHSHLSNEPREQTIDPIIQQCVVRYDDELDEDEQIRFKGSAKAFTRTYNFLVGILPYVNTDWEKLSIFLNYLIPDLKPPKEDDASKGILETIDTESYYAEIKATQDIALGDDDGELRPIPTSGGGGLQQPEMDVLSNIISDFNDRFGKFFSDPDKAEQFLTKELPEIVAEDSAYQNAIKNSDLQNVKIELEKATNRAINKVVGTNMDFYQLFADKDEFKSFVLNAIFRSTYGQQGGNLGK